MDVFVTTKVFDVSKSPETASVGCVGPYYGLREQFEDGKIYEGITTGDGIFQDTILGEGNEQLSFVAEKSRLSGEFRVSIRSKSLQQKLRDLTLHKESVLNVDWQNMSVSWFSNRYGYFKDERNACNLNGTTSLVTKELQLFIQDFLLLRELFDGFNFEDMYSRGTLSAIHWQDIQNAAAIRDIDELNKEFTSCAVAHDEIPEEPEVFFAGMGDWKHTHEMEVSGIDAFLTSDTTTEWQTPRPSSNRIFPKDFGIAAAEPACEACPLRIASQRGNMCRVLDLLQDGAPPTSTCSHATISEQAGNLDLARIPLVAAAQNGHVGVVQFLIEYGATEIIWHGQAATREAAANGYLDVVQTLVTSGVNVDAEMCWGRRTALEAAAAGGHEEIIRYLLRRGHPTTASLRRSLIAAAENGYAATWTDVDRDPGTKIRNKLRDYFFARLRMFPEAALRSEKLTPLPTRVHEAFKGIHAQLVSVRWDWKCHGTCACTSCPRKCYYRMIRYTDAWKQGVMAMKQMLRNRLPRSLGEVVSCLLVALAMGQQLESLNGADEFSQDFHILKDMYRWREHLSAEEIEIFDDIIGQMWGLGGRQGLFMMVPNFESRQPVHLAQQDDLLLKLQAMVSSLISGTGAHHFSSQDYTSFGTPLRKIYERYKIIKDTIGTTSKDRGRDMLLGANVRADGANAKRKPPIESWWHGTLDLPRICLLFAGAIFGMILAFLLIFRTGTEIPPIPQDSAFSQLTNSPSHNILARNCYLLALYLGLSSTCVKRSNDGEELELTADQLDRHTQSSSSHVRDTEYSNINLSDWSGHAEPHEANRSGMSKWLLKDDKLLYGYGSSSQTGENNVESQAGSRSNVTPRTTTQRCQSTQTDLTCPHCSKSFASGSNYTKHVNYHCDMISKQTYPCRNTPCGKAFKDPYYRKRHEERYCPYRRLV